MQAHGRRGLLRAVNTRAKAIWKHLSTDFPSWTPSTAYRSFIALVAAEVFTSIDYLSYFTTFRIDGRIFLGGSTNYADLKKERGYYGTEVEQA